jgi:hypothetical protein
MKKKPDKGEDIELEGEDETPGGACWEVLQFVLFVCKRRWQYPGELKHKGPLEPDNLNAVDVALIQAPMLVTIDKMGGRYTSYTSPGHLPSTVCGCCITLSVFVLLVAVVATVLGQFLTGNIFHYDGGAMQDGLDCVFSADDPTSCSFPFEEPYSLLQLEGMRLLGFNKEYLDLPALDVVVETRISFEDPASSVVTAMRVADMTGVSPGLESVAKGMLTGRAMNLSGELAMNTLSGVVPPAAVSDLARRGEAVSLGRRLR